ncbi:MAG: hypothetical protein HWE16_03485 [Gammaproteobacteria bacterium]|nr:hypothetical protein [Gammaproteobacteria bacterium]
MDSEQNILLVKIKNTNFWVTPGFYESDPKLINKKMMDLASEYGLTISKPTLRGKLKLTRHEVISDRYFYVSNKLEDQPKLPNSIESIKWLPLSDALNLLTFPHINILLKKIIEEPDYVWVASIKRYQEEGEYKAKLMDDFKSLSNQ